MKLLNVSRRILVTVSLLLAASSAFAQQQATKPFEPQVGQAGKDVVWVPTPQELVDTMLNLTQVTPQDTVYDLGSGDGRTVITAAKRGARAFGIEYNPDMVELSQRNAKAAGVSDRATFMKADLFETDFSKATVITMFLLPSINMQLRPKILDMKPGTRVASNTFTMEDWEPDQKVTLDPCDRWCTALFWIVPAKVEGTWRSAQGDLTLSQKFQVVTGTLGAGNTQVFVTNGKLRGDEITFTAGSGQYTGRVNGNRIAGTVVAGGRTSSWEATRSGQ